MDSDAEIEQEAELNPFTQNAKSSVKIKDTAKGPRIEVKVVTGENDLIDGLTQSAIKSYKDIKKDLNINKGGK